MTDALRFVVLDEPFSLVAASVVGLVTVYVGILMADLAARARTDLSREVLLTAAGLQVGIGFWASHAVSLLGPESSSPLSFRLEPFLLEVIPSVVSGWAAMRLVGRGERQSVVAAVCVGLLIAVCDTGVHLLSALAALPAGRLSLSWTDSPAILIGVTGFSVLGTVALSRLRLTLGAGHTFYLAGSASMVVVCGSLHLGLDAITRVALLPPGSNGLETHETVIIGLGLSVLVTTGGLLASFREFSLIQWEEEFSRDTDTWYRSMIDRSPEAIVIVSHSGQILIANASTGGMLGYGGGALPWLTVGDLLVDARSREPLSVNDLLGKDRTKGNTECLGVRGDGTTCSVEVVAAPLPSLPNFPDGIMLSIRDVTERLAALREAASQRTMLQEALQASPVGVVVAVGETIRLANDSLAAMTGVMQGDPLERIYTNRFDYESMLRSLAAAGVHRRGQIRLAGRDGKEVVAIAHFLSVEYERESAILGWLVDITTLTEAEMEMRRARDAAEAADRSKSDFLANMSHEIRTPLNAIIGMAHLALQDQLDPKLRAYVEKMQLSGRHLLGVINDILDFSKIEAGRLEIAHAEFDLEQVLRTVTTVVTDRAEQKGLLLRLDVAPEIPRYLVGDGMRVGQILINFVNNAINFTEAGQVRISIRLESVEGSTLRIRGSVSDTGVGIAPDVLPRLFQRFAQGDNSSTRRQGGTGLGLAISQRLAQLMGGGVGVESVLGQGSTFWFTVVVQASGREAILPLRSEFAAMRVLVVAMDECDRHSIERTLRYFGVAHIVSEPWKDSMTGGQALEPGAFDLVVAQLSREEMTESIQSLWERLGRRARAQLLCLDSEHQDGAPAALAGERRVYGPQTPSSLFEAIAELVFGIDSNAPGVLRERPGNPADSAMPAVGARVLLVEDNVLNQEVAAEILRRSGCAVDVAGNGRIALERLERSTYDLVFMDMQMPVMDGLEATRQIRMNPKLSGLPIIAMTANVLQADRDRCLQAGMNDYVAKPIEPSEVWATLRRYSSGMPASTSAPVLVSEPGNSLDASNSALPVIDGLDVALGLRRAVGDHAFYRRLIGTFVRDQARAGEHIIEAIEARDAELSRRLAHTLKGTAGSVGATAVQEQAAALESAIAEASTAIAAGHPVPSILDQTHALRDGLTSLTHAMRSALDMPQPAVAGASGVSSSPDAVARLERLLQDADPGALDALEECHDQLKMHCGDSYAEFARAVERFDFPAALGVLRGPMSTVESSR